MGGFSIKRLASKALCALKLRQTSCLTMVMNYLVIKIVNSVGRHKVSMRGGVKRLTMPIH